MTKNEEVASALALNILNLMSEADMEFYNLMIKVIKTKLDEEYGE